MLFGTIRSKPVAFSKPRRSPVAVRCVTPTDGDLAILARPTAPSPAAAAPVLQPAPTPVHPKPAPEPQEEGVALSPADADHIPATSTDAGRFPPDQTLQSVAANVKKGRVRKSGRLHKVIFMEESPNWFDWELTKAFMEYICDDGDGFAIRCLGRHGIAGALKFVLALREAGNASTPQLDVRIQLHPQDEIPDFGTPLMFFVNPKKGRYRMPQDWPKLASKIRVDNRLPFRKQLSDLGPRLAKLRLPGQFIQLDMVGTDNISRGMSLLAAARKAMGDDGKKLFAVPELVPGDTPKVRLFIGSHGTYPPKAT